MAWRAAARTQAQPAPAAAAMLPSWMGGAPESAAKALINAVKTSYYVDDRRSAIADLHELAVNDASSHEELGRDGTALLVAVLRTDADEDPDIARHCLETLVELSTGGVSANSAAFINIEGSVDLLLDLLAQQVTARSQPRPQRPAAAAHRCALVQDFYVRFATCQLLTALHTNEPQEIQNAFKNNTAGVGRLMDAMADSRHKAMIAKEALLLMVLLTQVSVEIKMAVVFDGAFDRTFDIVRKTFDLDAEGGVVVKDCLDLLQNLLRDNPPNQTYFRENGDVARLNQMLRLEPVRAARATSPPALLQNVQLMLEVIMALTSGTVSGTALSVLNQTKLGLEGVLQAVLDLGTADGQAPAIRTAALQCVERLVVDHATNSKLLTDYCRDRSLAVKLTRSLAIEITAAKNDGQPASLSDSVAGSASMDAVMASGLDADAEHAALRLAAADAKVEAEQEVSKGLRSELETAQKAHEAELQRLADERSAQAAAAAAELEQRVSEARQGAEGQQAEQADGDPRRPEIASQLVAAKAEGKELRDQVQAQAAALVEERALRDSAVGELEQRVASLTAELAALRQSGEGSEGSEAMADAAKLQAQHDAQRTDLESQLAAAKEEGERLRAKAEADAVLMAEREAASQAVFDLEQRASSLTAELSESREEAEAYRAEKEAQVAELSHDARRAELESQLAAAATEGKELRDQVQGQAAALVEERALRDAATSELEQRVASLTAELSALRQVGESNETGTAEALAKLQAQNADLESQLAAAKAEGETLRTNAEANATTLVEERESTSQAVLDLEQRASSLAVERNRRAAELAEAREEAEAYRTEKEAQVAELQQSHELQRTELESRLAAVEASDQQLQDQVQAQAAALAEERALKDSAVGELEQRVVSLNAELAALRQAGDAELSALRQAGESVEAGMADAAKLQAQTDARTTDLESQLAAATAEVETLRANAQANAAALVEERASTSTAVFDLEQRVASLTNELTQTRQEGEVYRAQKETQVAEMQRTHDSQRAELESQLAREMTSGTELQDQVQAHNSVLVEERALKAVAVAELEQRVSELEGQLRDAQQQATEKAESPTQRAGSPQIDSLLLEKSVPLTVLEAERSDLQSLLQAKEAELTDARALRLKEADVADLQRKELEEQIATLSALNEAHAVQLREAQAAAAQTSELEQQVAALNAQLSGARETAEAQESAARDAASKSVGLEERVSALTAELTAARQAAEPRPTTKAADDVEVHSKLPDSHHDAVQASLIRILWDAIHHHRRLFGVECKNLQTFVKILDRNGNGVISRKELHDTLVRLDIGLVDSQLEKLIGTIDANHDGHIDLVEFANWMGSEGIRGGDKARRAAEKAAEELASERAAHQAQLEEHQTQLRSLQERLDQGGASGAASAELDAARGELDSARGERDDLRAQVQNLETLLGGASVSMSRNTAELQQRVAELTRQLEAATEEVAMVQAAAEQEFAQLASDETDILICLAEVQSEKVHYKGHLRRLQGQFGFELEISDDEPEGDEPGDGAARDIGRALSAAATS